MTYVYIYIMYIYNSGNLNMYLTSVCTIHTNEHVDVPLHVPYIYMYITHTIIYMYPTSQLHLCVTAKMRVKG